MTLETFAGMYTIIRYFDKTGTDKDIERADVFTYDKRVRELLPDGTFILKKAVIAKSGDEILVEDILDLDLVEFKIKYPHPNCLEMRTNYRDMFDILEGEEYYEYYARKALEASNTYGRRNYENTGGEEKDGGNIFLNDY